MKSPILKPHKTRKLYKISKTPLPEIVACTGKAYMFYKQKSFYNLKGIAS